MAALAFAEIVKTFGRNSPNAGQIRLSQITRKISEQSEFEMEVGPDKLLYFRTDQIREAYENFDLETIQRFSSKRNPAFVDAEGNSVALTELTKSSEFGGAGGARGSGPDPHEIMTAALILHYGKRGKRSVPTNAYNNLRNASRVLLALKSTARQIDTTEGDFAEKVEAFDNNFEPFAQAISAANGFLTNLDTGSKVVKVYGTGRRWADILRPYKIDDHLLFGKKDYNSSDLIVEVSKTGGAKCFVGISLKKKGTGLSAADPTVINKTVIGTDGLFKSIVKQGYADVYPRLKNVYRQRSQFFYNVIEASLNSTDSRTRDHARRVLGVDGTEIPNYLSGLRRRISTVRSQGAFILAEAQKLGQTNMTNALQGDYPEGGVENIYFRAFDEIFMDTRAHKPLVISLLNIIFKTDLQGFLGIRGVPKDEFKFTLLTGKGAFSGGNISISRADELQETFTTSILTQKMNNPRTAYRVTRTPGKLQAFEGGPAKLFYTIYLSQLPLADIEIRYKGSIRSEPQFFAVITPKFKQLYNKVVRRNGGSKKW